MSIKAQELQGQINLSDSSPPRHSPHRTSSESFVTDSYSPRQSRFSFIEEDSEQGRALTHEEKLNILKQKAPKFTNDLKFWPIFDTHILCRYSFVFFYYYELCLFLLKLLFLMTVLSLILYTMTTVVQIGGDHEAHLWLFFGLSLITIFVIRLYCMKEEKVLLQDQNHPAEDWTENKFALLVQRLPVNATKDEIKQFFEKKIQENGYNDCVKKIMMLQECRKFVALEKKLRRKQYSSKKTIGTKQSLIEDIERVQEKINNLLASVDNYALYKGTAIIIFENIRGKIIIENYFGIGKFRRFFYSVLPTCFGKRYRFAGHIIKVKEAPEPSDLIFESVYISKTKIAFRRFLTYFLGNLAVFAGIGFIVIVRLNHNGDNMADWLNFPFYSYSAIVIGTAAVIYLFTDYLIEKIIINRTKSECEIEKIKFRLVISYLSINAYLVILMHFVPDFQIFQDQVFLTAILLAVFIPLRKFFSVISPRKLWLRRKLYRDPYCFEKYSQQEIINIFTDHEYDFANNVEDYVCFMFFALGFYFIGQLYIVVITLAGLILSICVDKLVMVRFTSPTKLKGSEMGLEFFRILRWDIRLQLLTIAFLPNTAFSADVPAPLRITLLVFYGIFLIWDFRATPGKMWKRKWSKEREETQYDNVEKYFSHRYESEYPLKTF